MRRSIIAMIVINKLQKIKEEDYLTRDSLYNHSPIFVFVTGPENSLIDVVSSTSPLVTARSK